jgi:quercetin dioxygenase-like cupin family protein
MHITLRVLLTAGALSAFVSGQEPQQRIMRRPVSPPDYMDDRTVDVARIAPDRATVEIDNFRMRVIRFRVPANSRVPIHGHRPGVIVAVTAVQLRVSGARGGETDVRLPAGDIRWMDAGVHSEENVGSAPAEYLYIEAKN